MKRAVKGFQWSIDIKISTDTDTLELFSFFVLFPTCKWMNDEVRIMKRKLRKKEENPKKRKQKELQWNYSDDESSGRRSVW